MLLSEQTETHRVHGPVWLQHLGHLAGQPGVSGLEIGTFKGESAQWMCEHIFTHPNSRYYCVDPFTGSKEHELAGVDCSLLHQIASQTLRPYTHCFIEKEFSHKLLPEWMDKGVKVDFVYIDGSHDSLDVVMDSFMSFKLLKVGGILCWDDYEWTEVPGASNQPKLGIDAFLRNWKDKLTVLHQGWQVLARKEKE